MKLNLSTLFLDRGNHDSPDEGMCVMEAVAYKAGEPFSDHPACASPVIGAFLRSWNDALDDDHRQELKQYVPRLIGTAAGRKVEQRRAWLATDYLVRVCAPRFLELTPALVVHAEALAGLRPVLSRAAASKAQPKIHAAREEAGAAGDAAWAAAWAAAGTAAWDAAWAAARAAARDAAEDAARDAAGTAAWDAARAAAWAAAGDAARAAAWAAAEDAARDAARAAAWDAAEDAARDAARAAARAAARDAARDAARAALRPAVEALRPAAFRLLDEMIAVAA